jgi:hypothetical protein
MVIGINDDVADIVSVYPEVFENPVGNHPEYVQAEQVDDRKGNDDIMT